MDMREKAPDKSGICVTMPQGNPSGAGSVTTGPPLICLCQFLTYWTALSPRQLPCFISRTVDAKTPPQGISVLPETCSETHVSNRTRCKHYRVCIEVTCYLSTDQRPPDRHSRSWFDEWMATAQRVQFRNGCASNKVQGRCCRLAEEVLFLRTRSLCLENSASSFWWRSPTKRPCRLLFAPAH